MLWIWVQHSPWHANPQVYYSKFWKLNHQNNYLNSEGFKLNNLIAFRSKKSNSKRQLRLPSPPLLKPMKSRIDPRHPGTINANLYNQSNKIWAIQRQVHKRLVLHKLIYHVALEAYQCHSPCKRPISRCFTKNDIG